MLTAVLAEAEGRPLTAMVTGVKTPTAGDGILAAGAVVPITQAATAPALSQHRSRISGGVAETLLGPCFATRLGVLASLTRTAAGTAAQATAELAIG